MRQTTSNFLRPILASSFLSHSLLRRQTIHSQANTPKVYDHVRLLSSCGFRGSLMGEFKLRSGGQNAQSEQSSNTADPCLRLTLLECVTALETSRLRLQKRKQQLGML